MREGARIKIQVQIDSMKVDTRKVYKATATIYHCDQEVDSFVFRYTLRVDPDEIVNYLRCNHADTCEKKAAWRWYLSGNDPIRDNPHSLLRTPKKKYDYIETIRICKRIQSHTLSPEERSKLIRLNKESMHNLEFLANSWFGLTDRDIYANE